MAAAAGGGGPFLAILLFLPLFLPFLLIAHLGLDPDSRQPGPEGNSASLHPANRTAKELRNEWLLFPPRLDRAAAAAAGRSTQNATAAAFASHTVTHSVTPREKDRSPARIGALLSLALPRSASLGGVASRFFWSK